MDKHLAFNVNWSEIKSGFNVSFEAVVLWSYFAVKWQLTNDKATTLPSPIILHSDVGKSYILKYDYAVFGVCTYASITMITELVLAMTLSWQDAKLNVLIGRCINHL